MNVAMAWHAPCSTGAVASSAKRIVRARRISSARWVLVLNAIVLWNTRYMGPAVDELRASGTLIRPEDLTLCLALHAVGQSRCSPSGLSAMFISLHD